MEMSGKRDKKNTFYSAAVSLDSLGAEKIYKNREIYRNRVKNKEEFSYRVSYKNTEFIISSNRDIKDYIEGPLRDIYRDLEFVVEKDPSFLKSLSPVKLKEFYPDTISRMCELSSEFDVGPMAAVAGTVNEYIASFIPDSVENLFIENGGDVYIRSRYDVRTLIYVDNPFFKDSLLIKIKASRTPCGLCASSGTFGHSLSLGKCDLAAVLSGSSISADAAATAIANSVANIADIETAINKYRGFDSVLGMLIIKDDRIGIWGEFELDVLKP
jgi:ApbE superfamily uncharacterized protein (UPF0280 family)